jgi:hypothetical protein
MNSVRNLHEPSPRDEGTANVVPPPARLRANGGPGGLEWFDAVYVSGSAATCLESGEPERSRP